ncbi:MAG: hypothetical protein KGO92_02005 [Bacteroidota bacterium]|nr:hypothetical protein [Bacteroidota bacterium]
MLTTPSMQNRFQRLWYVIIVGSLFCFPFHRVRAQYPVVDVPAVREEIREAKFDSTRARLYCKLGWALRYSNHLESEQLADKVIFISDSTRDFLRMADAYKIKGFARVIDQDLFEAQNMYKKGIAFAQKAKSPADEAHILSLTAGMYQDKGDFDKAIFYYLEGLVVAKKSEDPVMMATLANNLAEAYSDAGRPIQFTLPYYQEALKYETALENWQYVAMIYANIAQDYLEAGNRSEAERSTVEAIQFLYKSQERSYLFGTVSSTIGQVYLGLHKYAKAEKYLSQGYDVLDNIGTKDNKLIPLSSLARMFYEVNNLEKAEQTAEHLLVLARNYKTKLFLRDGYKVLSDIARQRKQPERALQYFELYKNWNDSLYNERRDKSIENVESRLQLNLKELGIKYEVEKKMLENQQLKQSNIGLQNKSLVAIILSILFLVMGLVLLSANRAKGKRNLLLENQKLIIEKQSQEKDTLIREINHRVKNNLQVISSLLNLQANSLQDSKATEALRDSYERIKAISLIHQKLYGFEETASIPLKEYILALFSDLKMVYAATNIDLICNTEPENVSLDVESAVPLGLILNEIITNALKYAYPEKRAGILHIHFRELANETYALEVKDDGVGLPENFDPELSASLGFRIIRELSRQLAGTYQYSSDATGTLFRLSFPNNSSRKLIS